ncbi:MAG: hypothetical protein EZS28_043052, partial [Streblomastix strix]
SQSITGKLIRTDSTESFDNLETRQFAAKYDIEGAFVKKTGKNLQVIEGYLRKGNKPQEVSEEDEDYITRGYVESKYVDILGDQQIIGTKSFFDNVTANEFIKSGGTNQQVLLANRTMKLLSEFSGTPTDLSNHYNKSGTYSRTETDNKNVRLEGSIQQTIIGRLKYVSPFGGTYVETQDPVENTYLTQSEVDAKLTNYVNTDNNQSINKTKTFNANDNATRFVKTAKDDTSVLLAGDVNRLLSAFGGLELVNINYTSNVVNLTSIMSLKCYRCGSLVNFYGYLCGQWGRSILCISCLFAGSAPRVANFRFGTDGKVTITIKVLTGTAGLAGAASAYINVTYPAAH